MALLTWYATELTKLYVSLAIDNDGNMLMMSLHAVITASLNASQTSFVGVRMNSSAGRGGVNGRNALSGSTDWILHYKKFASFITCLFT